MKNSLQKSTHYIQSLHFEDLSCQQFYRVAKLRQDVFIVEQQSIYSDLDGLDQQAMHYLCWSSEQNDAELIGYARTRQSQDLIHFSIERVVFSNLSRGKGLGAALMRLMINDITLKNTGADITLSAQLEAQKFYEKLGFVAKGESYDDGGIEHVTMHFNSQ